MTMETRQYRQPTKEATWGKGFCLLSPTDMDERVMCLQSRKRRDGNALSILSFLAMAVCFLFLGCSGGEDAGSVSMGDEEADQKSSCDFDVVVSEPSFCVIQGRTHNLDITLVPVAGVCTGSADLSVSGLPAGVTKEILPSPKIPFTRGTTVATVKLDTATMAMQKKISTSSLTFSASQKGLTRTAKADMTVDLPAFDFSLKPGHRRVQLHQEASASTTVKVELLGGGCKSRRPVMLSLDSSSLPPFISHNFSSESVVPPEETTLSFRVGSGPEIGAFKATLTGCCTDENMERTTEITLDVSFPRPPESASGEGEGPHFPDVEGAFKVETMQNMLDRLQLPEEALTLKKKIDADLATLGYIEASEEEVHRLQGYEAFFRPMDQVLPLLAFEPASLENTPFSGFRQEGGLPAGVDRNGQWTGVRRIFRTSDGAIVQLEESDLNTSGGYSVYAKEAINESIHGFPAVFVVEQSSSGKAITKIVWTTNTTDYTLEMEGNVKKNGQYDFFLSLARSIPQK